MSGASKMIRQRLGADHLVSETGPDRWAMESAIIDLEGDSAVFDIVFDEVVERCKAKPPGAPSEYVYLMLTPEQMTALVASRNRLRQSADEVSRIFYGKAEGRAGASPRGS